MNFGAFLALVLAAGLVGDSVEQAGTTPFIVRISENQTALHPTAGPNNMSNCLVVMPDGRLHLELRRQEFLDGTATMTTYESALDSKEIGILRSILDDPDVRALHPFAEPVVPRTFDEWHGFGADILRGAQVQHVGYLTWPGREPNISAEDKLAWKQAAATLQRLVEWSHAVKSNKSDWRRVANPKDVCGQ
jgi:hypothetical protein